MTASVAHLAGAVNPMDSSPLIVFMIPYARPARRACRSEAP